MIKVQKKRTAKRSFCTEVQTNGQFILYNIITELIIQEEIKMLEVIALVSPVVIGINGICEFLGLLGDSGDKKKRDIYTEKTYYR